MNKKSQLGNMTMILAFLFLLVIIGGGIYAGVYMFFGSGYDFRQVDADLLNYRISKCFQEKQIDFSLSDEEFQKQFFSKCLLNEQVIKDNFLLKIQVNNKTKYQWKGDETQCLLADKNPLYPKCKITTLTKNSQTIKIIVGSGQVAKKEVR